MTKNFVILSLFLISAISFSCKKAATTTPPKTTGHIKVSLAAPVADYTQSRYNTPGITLGVFIEPGGLSPLNTYNTTDGNAVIDLGEMNPGSYRVDATANGYVGNYQQGYYATFTNTKSFQVIANQDQIIYFPKWQ